MALNDEELLKLVTNSPGLAQINAVRDGRIVEVVLAVTATHAGHPFDEVEAELRRSFAASDAPIPEDDFDKMVRAISDLRLPE